MPYEIQAHPDRLEVAIDGPRAELESFLDLLQVCTKADGGCPALRCGKVETTVPAGGEGPIRIQVVPFPGVRIDPRVIERCLDFTLGCGARRGIRACGSD
ncbi:MAG: hypothetical protein U1F45_19665 [Burkholderiales bacterium]